MTEAGQEVTPLVLSALAGSQASTSIVLAVDVSGSMADENRLTDNTLQLARLDAPGVQLKLDWESAEEIVGAWR